MDYKLFIEDNGMTLRTDEESWNSKIVMTGITEFQFNDNFIIVSNDKCTKFVRFGDLTIDKRISKYLNKRNNESEEIEQREIL